MDRGFAMTCFLLAHSDPAIVAVDTILFIMQFEGVVGMAKRSAAHYFETRSLLESYLIRAHSFVTLPVCADPDDTMPMVQFIRTSQTLGTVDLDHDHDRFAEASTQARHPSILKLLEQILEAVTNYTDVRLPVASDGSEARCTSDRTP
jgi:hypothetical protein